MGQGGLLCGAEKAVLVVPPLIGTSRSLGAGGQDQARSLLYADESALQKKCPKSWRMFSTCSAVTLGMAFLIILSVWLLCLGFFCQTPCSGCFGGCVRWGYVF